MKILAHMRQENILEERPQKERVSEAGPGGQVF